MFVDISMCTSHVYGCRRKPEKNFGTTGAEVTDTCELLNVGVRN